MSRLRSASVIRIGCSPLRSRSFGSLFCCASVALSEWYATWTTSSDSEYRHLKYTEMMRIRIVTCSWVWNSVHCIAAASSWIATTRSLVMASRFLYSVVRPTSAWSSASARARASVSTRNSSSLNAGSGRGSCSVYLMASMCPICMPNGSARSGFVKIGSSSRSRCGSSSSVTLHSVSRASSSSVRCVVSRAISFADDNSGIRMPTSHRRCGDDSLYTFAARLVVSFASCFGALPVYACSSTWYSVALIRSMSRGGSLGMSFSIYSSARTISSW